MFKCVKNNYCKLCLTFKASKRAEEKRAEPHIWAVWFILHVAPFNILLNLAAQMIRSSLCVALITPHIIQRGWRYLVTITYSLVCTSKDREMAGPQSYIFSLEDCIDFSVDVIVARVVNGQTMQERQAFYSCGCPVAWYCPLILSSCHKKVE